MTTPSHATALLVGSLFLGIGLAGCVDPSCENPPTRDWDCHIHPCSVSDGSMQWVSIWYCQEEEKCAWYEFFPGQPIATGCDELDGAWEWLNDQYSTPVEFTICCGDSCDPMLEMMGPELAARKTGICWEY